MNENNITIVYHGTTSKAAKEILDSQNINDSNKPDEWLGEGKYFYDRYTNAIEYIIKKYKKNKEIRKSISYNDLIENYSILTGKIECKKEDILDLDEITVLSKFVWAWQQIYDKVKKNEEFKKLIFRDGYMIDYMINEIAGYKVVIKTFDRIMQYNINRRKENIVFDKTRIVYEVKQKYICVKDKSCIKEIRQYKKDFKQEYDDISKLDSIVNRRDNYEA